MKEEIAYDILDDGSVHFYIIVEGRKVSDFIVPQEIMVNISRDIKKDKVIKIAEHLKKNK